MELSAVKCFHKSSIVAVSQSPKYASAVGCGVSHINVCMSLCSNSFVKISTKEFSPKKLPGHEMEVGRDTLPSG